MAERRMFAKSVVESARFLKMPMSTQLLFFHLGMYADDDGVVEAYSVINLINSNADDLRVLVAKGFIEVLNEDLVSYIIDWKAMNSIRPDRKKDSIHKELLIKMLPQVQLVEKKERSDLIKKSGPSMDSTMTAQCSVIQNSIVEVKSGEGMASADKTEDTTAGVQIKYRMGDDTLTEKDYKSLVNKYGPIVVDRTISRIISKNYRGCLNISTISEWCEERMEPSIVDIPTIHSKQLQKLAQLR